MLSTSSRLTSSPGMERGGPSWLRKANITWKTGETPGRRLRLQLLDHPLEGDVLVLVGGQHLLPHPPQQLPKPGVAGQARA